MFNITGKLHILIYIYIYILIYIYIQLNVYWVSLIKYFTKMEQEHVYGKS